MATLGELVSGPEVPPSVRLRTSLAILDVANALKAEELGPTSAEAVQAKMDHQRFLDSLGLSVGQSPGPFRLPAVGGDFLRPSTLGSQSAPRTKKGAHFAQRAEELGGVCNGPRIVSVASPGVGRWGVIDSNSDRVLQDESRLQSWLSGPVSVVDSSNHQRFLV
jgi:hypothetical protein